MKKTTSLIFKKPYRFFKGQSNRILETVFFIVTHKKRMSGLKISDSKKRNILFIVPGLPIGGSERVVLNIAKGINRKEFNFHVITTDNFESHWYGKYQLYFKNIIVPFWRRPYDKICFNYFKELISKLNIDIVIISNSLTGYRFLPLLKSEFKNITAIDIRHADWQEFRIKEIVPYLDKRICISNHLKQHISQQYLRYGLANIYQKRLKVIHNGIDETKYKPIKKKKNRFKLKFEIPHETKIISFVGRLSTGKNLSLLVNIAKKIIETSHKENIIFVLAGEGEEMNNIRNMIKKYKIQNNFILTGQLNDNEIIELLMDTHILLITSKHEGIPLVISEALAMGVPVISTNVGAIDEIIDHNINGYLVDINKDVTEQFSSKILNLIKNERKYLELSKKTRKTILPEYSYKTMGNKYKEIFNKCINKK